MVLSFSSRDFIQPLEVYMMLSLGEQLGVERTAVLLCGLVKRRHRREGSKREGWRVEVKMRPVWASLVYRTARLVEDRGVCLERRRGVMRWLRREWGLVHRCVLLAMMQVPGRHYQLPK